jgi:hypothetical protein
MKELVLSNGVKVKCQAVPMTLSFDIAFNHPELQLPDEPVDEVKTGKKQDKIELVPSPRGSPKYKAWQETTAKVEADRMELQRWIPWQEGILEWQWPDDEWVSEAPSDYQVPRMIKSTIGTYSPYLDNERIAYVRYVLCEQIQDMNAVMEVILSGLPLTTEEVDITASSFQD